jgi:hypothetical protein
MIHYTDNWAGYSWQSSTVATAQFRTPSFRTLSAAERANTAGLAIWVGLGTGPDIEQVGIYDHVINGKVGWYGLYQFVPYAPQSFGGAINQGDLIRASVTRKGLVYTLTLTDVGHWSVSITKAFGHVENTAEAIVEDYSYGGNPSSPSSFNPIAITVSGVPRDKWITSWAAVYVTAPRQIEVKHA